MPLKTFGLRVPVVHFGCGTTAQVGPEARRLGAGRALVCCGPNVLKVGLVEPVLASLKQARVKAQVFAQVEEEPSLKTLAAATDLARAGRFNLFVGVGGGSSLDLTKMVAALTTNPGQPADYFGVDLVKRRGRPTILLPTTAGTGSEATRIAVFTDTQANAKKVISSPTLLADVAVVDPELHLSLPPGVTAATGLDAFVHAAESYLALGANPVSDGLALQAVQLVAENIGPAFANGQDLQARYHMALASLLAGITLNNAGVGVMHALSFPVGRECRLAHGPALTVILGESMKALSLAQAPKFRRLAEALGVETLGMSPWEASEAAVEAMVRLARAVGLPTTLTEAGAKRERINDWAAAAHANRRLLDNTPRRLSQEDLAGILERSF